MIRLAIILFNKFRHQLLGVLGFWKNNLNEPNQKTVTYCSPKPQNPKKDFVSQLLNNKNMMILSSFPCNQVLTKLPPAFNLL